MFALTSNCCESTFQGVDVDSTAKVISNLSEHIFENCTQTRHYGLLFAEPDYVIYVFGLVSFVCIPCPCFYYTFAWLLLVLYYAISAGRLRKDCDPRTVNTLENIMFGLSTATGCLFVAMCFFVVSDTLVVKARCFTDREDAEKNALVELKLSDP